MLDNSSQPACFVCDYGSSCLAYLSPPSSFFKLTISIQNKKYFAWLGLQYCLLGYLL